MKIITVKKHWVVFDEERVIDVESGEVAFAYAMLMAQIRPHKCIAPTTTYPVRSLVPHPKKRIITVEEREKIAKIKSSLSAKNI